MLREGGDCPKGFDDAEEPEAVIKTHGGKCDGRVAWAEGQLPDCAHPAITAMEVCPQRSGLRHLGMRTLVPFILGSLVKCYTQVTELNRFLVRWV